MKLNKKILSYLLVGSLIFSMFSMLPKLLRAEEAEVFSDDFSTGTEYGGWTTEETKSVAPYLVVDRASDQQISTAIYKEITADTIDYEVTFKLKQNYDDRFGGIANVSVILKDDSNAALIANIQVAAYTCNDFYLLDGDGKRITGMNNRGISLINIDDTVTLRYKLEDNKVSGWVNGTSFVENYNIKNDAQNAGVVLPSGEGNVGFATLANFASCIEVISATVNGHQMNLENFNNEFEKSSNVTMNVVRPLPDNNISFLKSGVKVKTNARQVFVDKDSPKFAKGSFEAKVKILGTDDKRGNDSYAHFAIVTRYNSPDDWQGIEIQFSDNGFRHIYDHVGGSPLASCSQLYFNTTYHFKVDLEEDGKCILYIDGQYIGTFALEGATQSSGYAGFQTHTAGDYEISDLIITSNDGEEPVVYKPELNEEYCEEKLSGDEFQSAKKAEIDLGNPEFPVSELTMVTKAISLSSKSYGVTVAEKSPLKKDFSLTTYFSLRSKEVETGKIKFITRLDDDGNYVAITYLGGEWGWETKEASGVLNNCLLGDITPKSANKLEIHLKDNGICIALNDFIGYTGVISQFPTNEGKIAFGMLNGCDVELYKVLYTDYNKTEDGSNYTEYNPDIRKDTLFKTHDQSAKLSIKKPLLSSGIEFSSPTKVDDNMGVDVSTVEAADGIEIDKASNNDASYVVFNDIEKTQGAVTLSFDFKAVECYDVRNDSGIVNITALLNYVSPDDFIAVNIQGTTQPNNFSSLYVYKNGFNDSRNRIYASDSVTNVCRMKKGGRYYVEITLDGDALKVKTADLADENNTRETNVTLSGVANKDSYIGFAAASKNASKNGIYNLEIKSNETQTVEFTNDIGKWEVTENLVARAFKNPIEKFTSDMCKSQPLILSGYGDVSDVKLSYDITVDTELCGDKRQGGTSSFYTYLRYKNPDEFIAVAIQSGDGSAFSCVYVFENTLSNRISHNSDNKTSVIPMTSGNIYNISISLDAANFLTVTVTDTNDSSKTSTYTTTLHTPSTNGGMVGVQYDSSFHEYSNISVHSGQTEIEANYELLNVPSIMEIGISNISVAFDENSPLISNFSTEFEFETNDGSAVLVTRYTDMTNYVGIICMSDGDWYYSNGNLLKSLNVNLPLSSTEKNTVNIQSFKNRYYITANGTVIYNGKISNTTTCAGNIGVGTVGDAKLTLLGVSYEALDNSTLVYEDDPEVKNPVSSGSGSGSDMVGEYIIDFTKDDVDLSGFEQEVYRPIDKNENIKLMPGKGIYLNFSGSGYIDRNSPVASDVDVTYRFSIPEFNLEGERNHIEEVRVGFGFRSVGGSTAYIMNDIGRWGYSTNDGTMYFFKDASFIQLELGKTYEIRILTCGSQLAVYMDGILCVKTSVPSLNIGAGNVGIKTWCNQPLFLEKIIYKAYDPSVLNFDQEYNLSPYFDMESRVGVLPYSDTRLPENTWMTVDRQDADSAVEAGLKKLYPKAQILNNTVYDIKMYLKTSEVANGSLIETVSETNKFGGCYLKFMLPEDMPTGKTLRIFKITGDSLEEQPDITSTVDGGIQLIQIELGKYIVSYE